MPKNSKIKTIKKAEKKIIKKIAGKGRYSINYQKSMSKDNPNNKNPMPGFLSNVLGTIGSGVGSIFGAGPIGGSIGKEAGALISKITGFGQYKVRHNTLMNNDQIPSFTKDGDGLRVTHRECLGDLASSISYVNHSFGITPVNVMLFPWLAQLAPYFQEFQFEGLVFEFKSTSSNALTSTNTALGTVIMSTNYDPDAEPFRSKIEMEAYEFTTSCCPAESMLHGVECKPSMNVLSRLYTVSADNIGSETENRFTNLGSLQVATVGMQADSAVIGELWCTYSVRLLKPKLLQSLSTTSFVTGTWDPAITSNTVTTAYGGVLSPVSNDYKITQSGAVENYGAARFFDMDSIFIGTPGLFRVTILADIGTSGTYTTVINLGSAGSNLAKINNCGVFNTTTQSFASNVLAIKTGTVSATTSIVRCDRMLYGPSTAANQIPITKSITPTTSSSWFNAYVERVADPNGIGNSVVSASTSIDSLIKQLAGMIRNSGSKSDTRTLINQEIDDYHAEQTTYNLSRRNYEENYQSTLNRVDGVPSSRGRPTN